MKPNVRRPDPTLVLTPATTTGEAWRVSLRCAKCHVPRAISVTQARYARVWDVDWATIFARVAFRCRCGTLADGLKVERLTRDRPEEVMSVWVRREYHG